MVASLITVEYTVRLWAWMNEVLNVKLLGCHGHEEEEDIKKQGMEEEEVRGEANMLA